MAQVQIDFAYLISLEVLMIQWICAYLRWIKLIFFEWFYQSANASVFYLQIHEKNTWQTSIFDLHRMHLSIDLWMSFIALNLHLFKMHSILDSLVHKPFFFSFQINMKEKWLHLFVVSWLHFSKKKIHFNVIKLVK